jgi:YggT family protein
MLFTLVQIIDIVVRLLILVIIVDSVISFFMSPFHPFRMALDGIVNPILAPIRRIVPPMGGLDLSPMVLIIVVVIIEGILKQILYAL